MFSIVLWNALRLVDPPARMTFKQTKPIRPRLMLYKDFNGLQVNGVLDQVTGVPGVGILRGT